MTTTYNTKEEVINRAQRLKDKSLRQVIPHETTKAIEEQTKEYGDRRKGHLGNLVEKYFFDINPGNTSEPDFAIPGIELKTTPMKKHPRKTYVSKERLVLSQINYHDIVKEDWLDSSFLKKNKRLLLMFYLWKKNQDILDYRFKFIHLLDLLDDISSEDLFQIQKDWEYIVAKVKRGDAHLLSEGDTYFLGACTKARTSDVTRTQPNNDKPAKPRAFSFKQQYINYLIQARLFRRKTSPDSIFAKARRLETIEDAIRVRFSPYIGKSDKQILASIGSDMDSKPKQYKRMLANLLIEREPSKMEELEKANVTIKAITLEPDGNLRESISFPAFDYLGLVEQDWYDEASGTMADFHQQLETKKFLFVVFQKKHGSKEIVLKKTMFWNFPMRDIDEAKRVWMTTVGCIREGRYGDLPGMDDSPVAHVRPHGRNANDTIPTPQGTREKRKSFWLKNKYIQKAIEDDEKST